MTSSPPAALPYTDMQRQEATDWFVIIQGEVDPNAESMQAWLRWMDEHEGNRAAFDSVAVAWHGTPSSVGLQMPSAEELLADAYDAEQSVADWLSATSNSQPVPQARARINTARISRRVWLSAASVLIAITGFLTVHQYTGPRDARSNEFSTRTGEQIEITLADGSHVWLGPRSNLVVAFNTVRRDIRLTRGEAFFAVKKDAGRPFTVRSPGGDIVAVGTAFNVRATDERVTVTVSEGIVSVMPKAQLAVQDPGTVRVASGEQLTFTARQPLTALAIVESATGERARWREGVLVYRDEPLQEVVSDVVRYSGVQIEIADASIGDLRYSGVIYQDAAREWISALPESFPVTIVSDGSREIIKAR
jgi:transmembrane sensor